MAELREAGEISSWNQVLAIKPPKPAKVRLTGEGLSGSTASLSSRSPPLLTVIDRNSGENVKGDNILPRLCRLIIEVLMGLGCLDSNPMKAAIHTGIDTIQMPTKS